MSSRSHATILRGALYGRGWHKASEGPGYTEWHRVTPIPEGHREILTVLWDDHRPRRLHHAWLVDECPSGDPDQVPVPDETRFDSVESLVDHLRSPVPAA